MYLLKGIGSYVSSYLMADVGQRVVMDLRNALYRHILGQSAGFFAHGATGQLMSRINNDVGQVQQAVSETVGDLARESLALVGYAALLFYYDARLTIVCLTGAPLIVYPLIRLGPARAADDAGAARRRSSSSRTSAPKRSPATASSRRSATEAHEAEKFNRAGYHLFRTNMKVTAALSSLPPLMELIGGIGMAAALVVRQPADCAGPPDDRASSSLFIGTLFLMYGPAKKLSRVNANLQQAIAASERIFEMLDTHTEVHRAARRRAAGAVPRTRSSSATSASATTRRRGRILRGVSFTVARRTDDRDRRPQRRRQDDARQPAAAVLRRQRRRDPDRRRRHPRTSTLASLRRQIGIVTQETVLFDDTIASNIAYGSPQATRAADRGGGARRQRARVHRRRCRTATTR